MADREDGLVGGWDWKKPDGPSELETLRVENARLKGEAQRLLEVLKEIREDVAQISRCLGKSL